MKRAAIVFVVLAIVVSASLYVSSTWKGPDDPIEWTEWKAKGSPNWIEWKLKRASD